MVSSGQKEGRTDSRLELGTSEDSLREMSIVTERIVGSALRPHNPLIHDLYLLQKVLAQENSDAKELATALCGVSASICKLISAMHSSKNVQTARPSPVDRSDTHRKDDSAALSSKTTLLATRQAFSSLLEGLHRLSNLPGGSQARGQVIWSLIRIFDRLLDQIYSSSPVHASQPPETTPRISKPRTKTQRLVSATPEDTQSRPKTRTPCQACRKRHRKCDGRVPICRNCEHWKTQCRREIHPSSGNTTSSKSPPPFNRPPESALTLCELTIAMMRCLDGTIPSDVEVLEGFLFLLLKRVGQAFRIFVFEDGILQDPEFEGIGSAAPNQTAINHQVIEAQAPCLIYLLEQAQLYTLSLHLQPQAIPHSAELAQNPTTPSSNRSSTTLSNHAHIRLQHTLLTAVFGDQTRSDFQAAFTPPKAPIDEDMTAKFSDRIQAEGLRDWFKQEVWRIIGWDALKRAIQLGEDKR